MVLQLQRIDGADFLEPRHDADRLLLLSQPHQRDIGVILGHADKMYQPCLRQGRHQPDIAGLQRVIDQL